MYIASDLARGIRSMLVQISLLAIRTRPLNNSMDRLYVNIVQSRGR